MSVPLADHTFVLGTRLPHEVALRLVIGGRRWHPIQAAASVGAREGVSLTVTVPSDKAVR